MTKIKRMYSPLVYPGGKGKVAVELAEFVLASNPKSFATPFGGGGATLLTIANADPNITLHYNDKDARIAALFHVLANPNSRSFDKLIALIESTVPSVELFDTMGPQNFSPDPANFRNPSKAMHLWAYAGLVRNRFAFSGVMHANSGVRGGRQQTGTWKVDARWNPVTLVQRLRLHRTLLVGRTTVTADDFADVPYADAMVIDPPYVRKADKLYAHWFTFADHVRLAEYVLANPEGNRWVVTYDNDPLVEQLYRNSAQRTRDMIYSIAQGGGAGSVTETELWVTS